MAQGLEVGNLVNILFESYDQLESDEEEAVVDEEEEENNEELQNENEIEDEYEISEYQLQTQIKQVRELVTWFKKSPLRNEVLQKVVVAKINKTLELLLDSKTRWDSLCLMLERFLLLVPSIKEALDQLGSRTKLDAIDIEMIKELISALQPIIVAVEFLSSNKIGLLEADVLLEELLINLEGQHSLIGRKLFVSVSQRIKDRRLEKIASIALYLNDPTGYTKTSRSRNLTYCTKTLMMEESVNLLKRLHENTHVLLSSQESNVEQVEGTEEGDCDPAEKFRKKVNAALKEVTEKKKKEQGDVESTSIKREFTAFEAYGHESLNIIRLRQMINSIRPTSTEIEGTFSIAGKFVSKLRTRLSDASVNALVFLKFWFKRAMNKTN